MERINRRLVLISLLFAALLGLGVYSFLVTIQDMATVKYSDPAVVAAVNIPSHTVITADMVKLENVPTGSRHTQALTSLDQAVGKQTTQPVIAGEQVLSARLFSSGSAAGMAYQLLDGQRAVSISIDPVIAVAYLLRPGDAVDVLMTTATSSKTVLQNIRILAVGNEVKVGSKAPEDAETLTLAVTPGQAEQLTWAEGNARIRLSLRPATDQQLVQPSGSSTTTPTTAAKK